MSRLLRYQVAASLDGFIAGPNGEYDWIVMDRSIDFGALFKEFDTAVMGRKTYEAMAAQGGGAMPGLDVVVFSQSPQCGQERPVTDQRRFSRCSAVGSFSMPNASAVLDSVNSSSEKCGVSCILSPLMAIGSDGFVE